jgi:hypothetical protein
MRSSGADIDRRRTLLMPQLIKGERTPETLKYAADTMRFTLSLFGDDFDALSPEQQGALVELQITCYAPGSWKPSAETQATLSTIRCIAPVFARDAK